MLSSLSNGVTGLEAFQQEMDVIGNNIANINTPAFKAATTDFADALSDTIRSSSAGTATTSGVPSMQVGTGVSVAAIADNWSAGTLTNTGVSTDLGISGNGFFIVRDTVTNANYVTQAGNFSVDANGYMVTPTGQRVQGYSDAALTTTGDIKIDTTGEPATSSPTATISSYTVDQQGKITVNLSDGTSFVRGQLLLQNFQAPQMLISEPNNLYSGMANAGGLAAMSAAGTSGLGTVQSGYLEASNVDLSNEMANLITAQRAFEANSKIITTSDEMLQVLDNLKH
jgi:flagellar hook protein FlgE